MLKKIPEMTERTQFVEFLSTLPTLSVWLLIANSGSVFKYVYVQCVSNRSYINNDESKTKNQHLLINKLEQ